MYSVKLLSVGKQSCSEITCLKLMGLAGPRCRSFLLTLLSSFRSGKLECLDYRILHDCTMNFVERSLGACTHFLGKKAVILYFFFKISYSFLTVIRKVPERLSIFLHLVFSKGKFAHFTIYSQFQGSVKCTLIFGPTSEVL